MKKAVTILSICLLAIAGTKTIQAQTDEKMSEEEIEVRMNLLIDMATRNRILNSREKKIAFSKDYKNTIYEVKDLEYKYVYFVGDKIVPLPFDEMKPLLPFRVYVKYKIKGKWGAFEVGGKELLKPEYDEIKYENITHNYFYVRKGNEDYYINPFTGNRQSYLIVYEKSESFPKDVVKNGHYGLVNKEGNLIAPLKYDKIFNFNRATGLAAVELNKRYGFINQSGKEVIPLKYDDAENFSEGLAMVKENHKYGYIDDSGKEIIPMKYDGAGSFSEGLASVKLNGRYGFIDKSDNEIIPLKLEYDYVGSFSKGLAKVVLNKKSGFIDKSGKEVVPLKYDYIFPFREGLAVVVLNKKYGFIDESGKEVIPVKYDYANNFYEEKAEVTLNGRTFYIDKNGNEINE